MYERMARQLLKRIGVPNDILGHKYVVDAIVAVVHDPDKTHGIVKGLYADVAQRNSTTVTRVERAIRHAIETAFDRSGTDEIYAVFGNTIRIDKGKPTNRHFIAAMAEYVRDAVADEREV